MTKLKLTRRAVLSGTAASLTGLPGDTQRPVATVDLTLTVNGQPLLISADPSQTLIARCARAELAAM
jgi:hypothetical protein